MLADGFVAVIGTPVRKVSFAELAAVKSGLLKTSYRYNSKEEVLFAYGFAAAFAEVEVDTGTGEVKICRFVSSHDVGRAINPIIVDGQIRVAFRKVSATLIKPCAGRVINLLFHLRTKRS